MQDIVDFIFEINNLKRFEHCGTKFAGVKNPDSIAEHVFRTSQIAYILAHLEGLKPLEILQVLEVSLFHDNGEVRVNDTHKIASRYIDTDEAEECAFMDQLSMLPESIHLRLAGIVKKYNKLDDSIVFKIVKDADLLETMFQAKEYLELGYKTQRWIDNAEKYIQTESGKKIFMEMKKRSFVDWWDNLNRP